MSKIKQINPTNLSQVRRTVTKSRIGFQRIIRGPKTGILERGVLSNRKMIRFASGLGIRKFTSTPFKIIGIRF